MLLTKQAIHDFFALLQQANPAPATELIYHNSYTLLVAVVLSAQATDTGVNKATNSLFTIADTPEKMLELGLDNLKGYLKTLNLYNNKSKNVIGLSEMLIKEYQGRVPNTREALETLPGVGRKTANVVLNVAFGQPTLAVDTHIFRVSNRTGLAPGKTPLAVEMLLEKKVPKVFIHHAHHWLILHGRYICKARKPLCYQCPVMHLCEYDQKNLIF